MVIFHSYVNLPEGTHWLNRVFSVLSLPSLGIIPAGNPIEKMGDTRQRQWFFVGVFLMFFRSSMVEEFNY